MYIRTYTYMHKLLWKGVWFWAAGRAQCTPAAFALSHRPPVRRKNSHVGLVFDSSEPNNQAIPIPNRRPHLDSCQEFISLTDLTGQNKEINLADHI